MPGVVALGDSITNGRSWAHWLAQALGRPLTNLARDGATAREVVAEQLPAVIGEYDLGCVYVGVNDARGTGWDPDAYARDLATILGTPAQHCERTLVLTLPLRLGLPPAGADLPSLNATIAGLAAEHGAVVGDLSDFAGARWVWADRVHATERGQLEIADRAARAIDAPRLPSTLVELPAPGVAHRTRYARHALREHVRALYLTVRHSRLP